MAVCQRQTNISYNLFYCDRPPFWTGLLKDLQKAQLVLIYVNPKNESHKK